MMFNIYYDNKLLFTNLNESECKAKLLILSNEAADGVIDDSLVEVEEL